MNNKKVKCVTASIKFQLFTVTTVPTNLVQKAWGDQVWVEATKAMFFNKFTGTSEDSIIQTQTELQKQAGDQITVPLVMELTGDGVSDDATLEGNEEALSMYDCAVQVHQYRHAVRIKGKFEEQKSQLKLRSIAKTRLKNWVKNKNEDLIVAKLTASPTSEHTIFPSGVNQESDITASNKFTASLISKAARLASNSSPKMRKVHTEYGEYYVLLIDPYQARDLKSDNAWLEAQKHANVRGLDNPLFTGAIGLYDGVVVYEYERLPRTETGASDAVVGHGLLLGCQAGVMAVAQTTNWEEEMFDYKNQYGVAIDEIVGFAKSKFNNKDFAVIQVITSSAND